MNTSNDTSHGAKEKLIEDLKVLAQDAQDLLKGLAGDVRQKTRDRTTSAMETARSTREKLGSAAREQAHKTDRAVRQKPYHTMGIAFAAGLVIGFLLRPKQD